MTKFLISFPSAAMQVADDELPAVADAGHAVIREAKRAGVYVFAGGVKQGVEPVLVAGDGTVAPGTHPETGQLDGGYTIIDVPTRDEAVMWAAKIAAACRCAQELREFEYDPEV